MAGSQKRKRKEVEVKAEYNLRAVIEYSHPGLFGHGKVGKDMILKAKQHLLYARWDIHLELKKVKDEIREKLWYYSPAKKRHVSLREACKAYLKEEEIYDFIFSVSGEPRDSQIVDKAEDENDKDPCKCHFAVGTSNHGIHHCISKELRKTESQDYSGLENCDDCCKCYMNQPVLSDQVELNHVPLKTMDIESQDFIESGNDDNACEISVDEKDISDEINYVHVFEPPQEILMQNIAENPGGNDVCKGDSDGLPVQVFELQHEVKIPSDEEHRDDGLNSDVPGNGLVERVADVDESSDIPNDQARLTGTMAEVQGEFYLVPEEQMDITSQDSVEQGIKFAYECHVGGPHTSSEADPMHGFEPQQDIEMQEIAGNQTTKDKSKRFTDEGASAQGKFFLVSKPQLQIEIQSVAEQGKEVLSNDSFGIGSSEIGRNLDDSRDAPIDQERLTVRMHGGLGDVSDDRTREQVREVDGYSCRLKTLFALLIEQNIILLGESVHYRGRQGTRMAEGQVYKDGIRCSCCHQSFSLSFFEAHAGSTHRRPAANIYLEDGRSLSDCRLQLKRFEHVVKDKSKELCNQVMKDKVLTLRNQVIKGKVKEPRDQVNKDKMTKPAKQIFKNDDSCLVCHGGDALVSCGSCPSSFHLNCVQLKISPGAKCVYCPSCCCGICGVGQMKTNLFRKKVKCRQCGHPFHLECLRRSIDSVYLPNKEWFFCNSTCESMFLGLRNILWKPTELAGSNLNCTFLLLDVEGMKTKLDAALKLVEQSLKHVNDPLVIGRISKLKLLVLKGYYLLMLRRDDDEVITTAFVRVHVGKVAEVALVATRLQYQRRGMCRILMNFLESELVKLIVERLVLSAVPSITDACIGGFGFVKMTQEERLMLLDYTFLDFPSNILFQKFLKRADDISSDGYRENDICTDRRTGLKFLHGTGGFQFSMPKNNLNNLCPIEQSLQDQPFNPWAPRLKQGEKLKRWEKDMTYKLIDISDLEYA